MFDLQNNKNRLPRHRDEEVRKQGCLSFAQPRTLEGRGAGREEEQEEEEEKKPLPQSESLTLHAINAWKGESRNGRKGWGMVK
jgi:hypothetical protein